ncbi:MAG: hypothetical protein IPG32_08670 [Saprospirales bacterium]|nr:hypothetical protein [Saprospirales bacterium]
MRHLWIFMFFLPLIGFSQEDLSVGFSVGGSNYQGDLTVSPLSNIQNTKLSAALFIRVQHNDYFNTKVNIQYGSVEASDAEGGLGRATRNLSFSTNIWEAAVIEEINLIGFNTNNKKFISPYLFGGVAVFHYNPKTEYFGQIVELQPLGTEGQGIPGFAGKYSLFQVAIPLGGGLKLALSKDATLSFEMGGRELFTDYLDDVSGPYADSRTLLNGNGPLAAALGNRIGEYLNSDPVNTPGAPRGNPKYSDWYFFSTVSVSFALDGDGSLFGRNMRILPCFRF